MSDMKLAILINAQDNASKAIQGINGKIQGMSQQLKIAGAALTAVGTALTASLGIMGKAAVAEDINIKRLATTMANVGVEYDGVKESLEGVIAATQYKTGVADNEQRDVLNRLILTTGNYATALELLPTVLDLAAAGEMDATTAATYLGKAHNELAEGATEVSVRFGQASLQFASMEEIQNRVRGAAENLRDPLEVLKADVGDLGEAIGTTLIPMLTDAVEKVHDFVTAAKDWIEANPELSKALTIAAAAVGVVTLALGGLLLMLPAVTAAIATLGVTASIALAGLPIIIGAVVTGIALLVANWDKVAKFFGDLWDNIKIIFATAVNWITEHVFAPWIKNITDTIGGMLMKIGQMVSIFDPALGAKINNVGNQIKSFGDEVVKAALEWADALTETAEASKVIRQAQYDLAQATATAETAMENYGNAAVKSQVATQEAIADTLKMMNALAGTGSGSGGSNAGGSGGSTGWKSSDYWAKMYLNGNADQQYQAAWNMTSSDWLNNNLLNLTGMTRDEAVISTDKASDLGFVSAATGAILTKPTALIAGDNVRSPEAVIPLDRLAEFMRGYGVGNSGESVNYITTNTYLDGKLIATETSKQIGKMANSRSQMGGS